MLQQCSNKKAWLKVLFISPIVAVSLAVNAGTFSEPQKSTDEKPFTASGRVGDKNTGEPIVGAAIKIVGSTKGTVSDKDGRFTLTVKRGDKVQAAYVGYESQSLPIRNYNEIGLHLEFDLVKENVDKEDKIYDAVEQMPVFPGGKEALNPYIAKNIKYPIEAEKAGIQGRVHAAFIIEKDGSVTGARIIRTVDPQLDAEAMRIIRNMPKWTPGMQDGKPVRVKYLLPVNFRLDGNDKTISSSENTEYYVDNKLVDATILKTIDPKTVDHIDVLKNESDQMGKVLIYRKK